MLLIKQDWGKLWYMVWEIWSESIICGLLCLYISFVYGCEPLCCDLNVRSDPIRRKQC